MQRRELLKILAGLPVGATAGAMAARWPGKTSTARPQPVIEVRPGELTVLTGRPCNGKTTLALSVALDYAEARSGVVWFLSFQRTAAKLARSMGLTVVPFATVEQRRGNRLFRSSQLIIGDTQLPSIIFDDYLVPDIPLAKLQELYPALRGRDPSLVIYDIDFNVTKALTEQQEHWMTLDLLDRRQECAELYDAAMIATLSMPGIAGFDPENLTSHWPELIPRRGAVADEKLAAAHVYSIKRPLLYDPDYANGRFDILEVTGDEVRHPDGHEQLLVWDKTAKRLRKLNHMEAQQAFGRAV